MAFNPGYKSRILLGDFSLSAYLASLSVPHRIAMHNVTTYADNGVKRFIPGISESSVALAGFHDAAAAPDAAAWTDSTALTVAPIGLSRGATVITLDALRGQYTTGSLVASAVSFDLAGVTDGYTDWAVSLHDLKAETADADETSVDGSASSSGGGVGTLHVTAYSGFSSAVLKVQHSTDNSIWGDLITFTTVTTTTSQRSSVTGTVNRYLRASLDVTGTGSVTYQMSFARR